MKKILLLLVGAFLAGSHLFAVELPETLTIGEETFTGVRYSKHDPAWVTFTHDSGLCSIEIVKLPPDVQALLAYDPVQDEIFRQKSQVRVTFYLEKTDSNAKQKEAKQKQLADAEKQRQAAMKQYEIRDLNAAMDRLRTQALSLQEARRESLRRGNNKYSYENKQRVDTINSLHRQIYDLKQRLAALQGRSYDMNGPEAVKYSAR